MTANNPYIQYTVWLQISDRERWAENDTRQGRVQSVSHVQPRDPTGQGMYGSDRELSKGVHDGVQALRMASIQDEVIRGSRFSANLGMVVSVQSVQGSMRRGQKAGGGAVWKQTERQK